MKKSITILGLIVLTSCTKNWNCQVTNSYNGQTSTTEVHFYGTTEEKNEYEEQNTFDSEINNGGTLSVETVCVPD